MFRVKSLVYVVLGLIATLGIGGCGNSENVADGLSGSPSAVLHVEVNAASIHVVRWEITREGMEPMGDTIDIRAEWASPSVEVFGLAAGDGYTVTMSATSIDGGTTCKGEAGFRVTASQTTAVMVTVRCQGPPEFGAGRFEIELNFCAELTNAIVSPLQSSVGSQIDVSAESFDEEDDPVEHVWKATAGSFDDSSAAQTKYNCDEAGTHTLGIAVSDDGFGLCNSEWTVDVTCGDPGAPEIVRIFEIQGIGHISPYVDQQIATEGIVTAVAFNGFYLQDTEGDDDTRTSDGIFVFGDADVSPGHLLTVAGTVSEFIPGGAGTGNLSITQIGGELEIEMRGTTSGEPTISPVVIGRSGRIPPNVTVISEGEIEPPINLQNPEDAVANPFDPDVDGVDFYESLEGMLVTIEDAVAVSATRTFSPFSSEFVVLANNAEDVEPGNARNRRGGIDLQPDPDNRGDQNPERVQVQLDGTLFPASVPAVTVGDRLGDITGVVGYSFGNFEVNAIKEFVVLPGSLAEERTRLRPTRLDVTIGCYNVLNLSPDESDDNQRATLARHIAHNLRSPDVVALQEIQDNSGELDDGVTDGTATLKALVDAIVAAGGPEYAFFDVAPEDGASGGIPGGNIRNAYLYNPEWIELVGFESLTPDALSSVGVTNPDAFLGTRDPLLATFRYGKKEFTVINNHLTSRFGSTPIFGGPQPFVQAGESEREAQVTALNEVVDALLEEAPRARIVVLGDLNTFEFTNDIKDLLQGTGDERVLYNLIDRLRDDEVYTFNFEGNSQVLDHVLVTRRARRRARLDIVHVNVDFPRVDDSVGSDHEPLVLRLRLGLPGHGYHH